MREVRHHQSGGLSGLLLLLPLQSLRNPFLPPLRLTGRDLADGGKAGERKAHLQPRGR